MDKPSESAQAFAGTVAAIQILTGAICQIRGIDLRSIAANARAQADAAIEAGCELQSMPLAAIADLIDGVLSGVNPIKPSFSVIDGGKPSTTEGDG